MAIFWHVLYLIVMGSISAYLIFTKIKEYKDAAAGSDIAIDLGWKLLLFGMLNGSTTYLAGQALSIN